MHHKKGQPSAATSHESRPGKLSFGIFGLRTRHTRSVVEQITRNTGLGKPLGLYPDTSTRCYTTTWRSNELTSSRPRRQRHHKNQPQHKHQQSSRFRPSSTQAPNTRTLTWQPEGREQGDNAPRQAQPADTRAAYDPCNKANATAPKSLDDKSTA